MEAKDLMIGDYVYNHRYWECPIVEIHKNSAIVIARHYEEEEFLLSDLRPIPLTTEILEKNGFEVQDQGGGRKDLWTGFGIAREGDIEVEFQDNIPIHLKIDGAFNGEYYTSSNITYIHQLQHALRLCGITKEIEL